METLNESLVNGRKTTLSKEQNKSKIKKMILSILNEQKVSLSQTREIFESILIQIEDKNPITL